MATSGKSLSFSFNRFSTNQPDLALQGHAVIGNNVLQLTPLEQSRVGRALFSAPVQLWDTSSATVASFETTFTFTISKPGTGPLADGLTFFMTPVNDIAIPQNSNGMHLGVFGPNGSRAGVVAVEFDTFINRDVGDPNHSHIGIDVNSIRSVATAQWNPQTGQATTARITYEPSTRRLTVTASRPGVTPTTLTREVELKTVLPEWVRVGLSASTGLETQITTIRSWSFTSTLLSSNTLEAEAAEAEAEAKEGK